MIDIKAVGQLCAKHNLRFIVDASQTAGMFPIDTKDMGIDILCFTGHKSLYGPQGTGGMVLGPQVRVEPLKVGGSGIKTFLEEHPSQLPNALEAGTLNGHGIVGLGAALDYIGDNGMDALREQALHCMWHLYDGIKKIPGVKILGNYSEKKRCPIVSFNVRHYASSKVGDVLQSKYDIATRSGGHCAPLVHKGFQTQGQGAVRMSFSHNNTIEEVNVAIQAIKDIAL